MKDLKKSETSQAWFDEVIASGRSMDMQTAFLEGIEYQKLDLVEIYRKEIDMNNFAIDCLMAVMNGETTMADRLNELEARVDHFNDLISGILVRSKE